jgi:probable rRNA maturation factor
MQEVFLVTYKTITAPRIKSAVFRSIKNEVLGESYNLSLVFMGTIPARKLNREYRQKDYATDILSFPISKDEGEIIICPEVLKKKSKEFGRTESNYLQFLFIHGVFHLKGLDHGAIMERQEKKIREKFNV